eukprot:350031-Chlamydomonas_euryale.AAC.2
MTRHCSTTSAPSRSSRTTRRCARGWGGGWEQATGGMKPSEVLGTTSAPSRPSRTTSRWARVGGGEKKGQGSRGGRRDGAAWYNHF